MRRAAALLPVATDGAGKTAQAAFRSPWAVCVFLAVAAAGAAADLASKHLVFESMLTEPSVARRAENIKLARSAAGDSLPPPGEMLHALNLSWQILPSVRFTASTNPGIVFGLPLHRGVVAAATFVTIALVCFLFVVSARGASLLHVGLGCVLAGALGNLNDRLFAEVVIPGGGVIRYQVRDFIDFSELGYPWTFNGADVLLVVGVSMCLLHSFLTCRAKSRPAKGRAPHTEMNRNP